MVWRTEFFGARMRIKHLGCCALAVAWHGAMAQDWVQWPVNGHWYRVVRATNGISWTQAQAAAASWGGYLASPSSTGENNFVFNMVKPLDWWQIQEGVNVFGPWIGLYQLPGSREPDGGFAWASGQPSQFRNWMAGEPNDNHGLGGEDKVHLLWKQNNPQPYWNDLKDVPSNGETLVKGYVIETDGWVRWPVNGHWYRAFRTNNPLSWTEARNLAQGVGGYLATPNSAAENNHIFSMVSSSNFWTGVRGPWLGGFQAAGQQNPASGWQWVSGEAWGFTQWAQGQPDDAVPTESKLHYFNLAGVPARTWNDLTDTANESVSSYIVEADKLSSTMRPSTWATDIGTTEAGSLDSLFASDQAYLRIRSAVLDNPAQAPITVSTSFVSPTLAPKQMSVSLRNRVSRSGLTQEILMYDFPGRRWDVVDVRSAPVADYTTAVTLNAPGQYVRQTDRVILARWRIKRVNGSQTETWRTYTDRVAVTVVR